mgnify:CR=1 FL=1
MINKKVVICTTIKNEEKNLKPFFRILDNIIKNFGDYFLVFVESESNDRSSLIIQKYLNDRKGKLLNKKLDPNLNRIHKLEICRNEYLKFVTNNKFLTNFNYLIVLDADGVNNNLSFKKIYNSILSKEDWNAIFANQNLFYYDIFALRIKNLITKNFLKQISEDINLKLFKNYKYYIRKNLTKFFSLNNLFQNRFIEVNSAFGGFGIYKMDKIIEFKYNSNLGENCEHVSLNEDINLKYGRLYIDKKLTNCYGINKHTLNGYLSSISNFFAKRFLKKMKILK